MKGSLHVAYAIIFSLFLRFDRVWSSEEKKDAAKENVRVLTIDELKLANGVDSDKLYLGIFGRVYDVSAGRDYYGPDGPYHIFAGRDAPVPFVTGTFTEEEAAKPWHEIPAKQHGGMLSWLEFYEKEEKYPFVGVVEGEFYDKDGQPLPELTKLQEAMAVAKAELEAREQERKRKVAERERRKKLMSEL